MGDAASAIIGVAFAGTVIMLFGPLVRALARRLEGRGGSTELLADVEALQGRVDQLEAGQSRVAELEERLDFAERLLAQTREPGRLQQ